MPHPDPAQLHQTLPGPADTLTAGRALGAALPAQAVVLLQGSLGSGKTTFIKGACEALGIAPHLVTSPTYTLVNIYQGQSAVYHVDLFRLEESGGSEALADMDMDDWLNPDGPTFIEWPGPARPYLEGIPVLEARFGPSGAGRVLTLESGHPEFAQCMARLAREWSTTQNG